MEGGCKYGFLHLNWHVWVDCVCDRKRNWESFSLSFFFLVSSGFWYEFWSCEPCDDFCLPLRSREEEKPQTSVHTYPAYLHRLPFSSSFVSFLLSLLPFLFFFLCVQIYDVFSISCSFSGLSFLVLFFYSATFCTWDRARRRERERQASAAQASVPSAWSRDMVLSCLSYGPSFIHTSVYRPIYVERERYSSRYMCIEMRRRHVRRWERTRKIGERSTDRKKKKKEERRTLFVSMAQRIWGRRRLFWINSQSSI